MIIIVETPDSVSEIPTRKKKEAIKTKPWIHNHLRAIYQGRIKIDSSFIISMDRNELEWAPIVRATIAQPGEFSTFHLPFLVNRGDATVLRPLQEKNGPTSFRNL